jgi:hypothetical protein
MFSACVCSKPTQKTLLWIALRDKKAWAALGIWDFPSANIAVSYISPLIRLSIMRPLPQGDEDALY